MRKVCTRFCGFKRHLLLPTPFGHPTAGTSLSRMAEGKTRKRTSWETLDARLLATATLTAVPHEGNPQTLDDSLTLRYRLWRLFLGEDLTADAPTSL
ncbi:MAG: hypothetical protein V7L25_11820 [Nostoc sp.]|uniref:hypothetical protein n=1 Tax=Nostoc sp. TaxID=1180 RepID=UPI002FF2D6B1